MMFGESFDSLSTNQTQKFPHTRFLHVGLESEFREKQPDVVGLFSSILKLHPRRDSNH